jgi:hypothetical protein
MTLKSKILAGAAAAFTVAAFAVPAGASAPSPFPVYDSGSALVTARHVVPGGRLVIAGHPVTLGSVTHPGPAYVAHVLGVLPASWKGRTLAAVVEG